MGSWNYKIFGNDDSCDFIYNIIIPIEKLAENKYTRQNEYNEIRAAVEIVIKLSSSYNFEIDLVEKLQEKLQFILGDKDWVTGWKNRRSIRNSLKKQVEELNVVHYKCLGIEKRIKMKLRKSSGK